DSFRLSPLARSCAIGGGRDHCRVRGRSSGSASVHDPCLCVRSRCVHVLDLGIPESRHLEEAGTESDRPAHGRGGASDTGTRTPSACEGVAEGPSGGEGRVSRRLASWALVLAAAIGYPVGVVSGGAPRFPGRNECVDLATKDV